MTAAAPEIIVMPAYEAMLAAAGLADYDAAMTTQAGESLIKPGLGDRERIRLELPMTSGGSQTFYLKRYGANEPAATEWEAVRAVCEAGVPTMQPVAMGTGPAGGFIVVTAVPGDSLSRCMEDLLRRRADDPIVGIGLASQLGTLAAMLHAAGLAHRDLYTAHIFVDETEDCLDLYLIDLARVFRPLRRRWRWWLKDLAQLKFSLPPAWRRRHWGVVRMAYESYRRAPLPVGADWVIGIRAWRMARRMRRKLGA